MLQTAEFRNPTPKLLLVDQRSESLVQIMLCSEDLPDPIHQLDLREAGVERDPTERVVKRSELQTQLSHLFAVWLWTDILTSVNL